MTTAEDRNLKIANNNLYIVPTLTSEVIDGGKEAILNKGKFDLGTACTTKNRTACSVTAQNGRVVNPVQSARINTKGKRSIQFGKVEVRAKLPRGDWLWPAIWMLPDYEDTNTGNSNIRGNGTYGSWPMSGEIDIMEARGNGPEYPGQGNNYVRSSLNYGPIPSLAHSLFGWFGLKQSTYASSFHTFTLEWDPTFVRFYVDSRLKRMLELRTRKEKEGWWGRGNFPLTAQDKGTEVVVKNPWPETDYSAPFNQSTFAFDLRACRV
jgi:beta-glucanase (GH16 family)